MSSPRKRSSVFHAPASHAVPLPLQPRLASWDAAGRRLVTLRNTSRDFTPLWTTGEYIKVGSTDRAVLEQWAREVAGGPLQDGCPCNS